MHSKELIAFLNVAENTNAEIFPMTHQFILALLNRVRRWEEDHTQPGVTIETLACEVSSFLAVFESRLPLDEEIGERYDKKHPLLSINSDIDHVRKTRYSSDLGRNAKHSDEFKQFLTSAEKTYAGTSQITHLYIKALQARVRNYDHWPNDQPGVCMETLICDLFAFFGFLESRLLHVH